MKKGIIMLMTLVVFAGVKVKADEGMWLPMFIERLNYVDMQKMGLQLTPEEIYSVNQSSLKDAIIGLSEGATPQGYFCTGELVSQQGLMFTNHHCGYDVIQKHSSLEHDYLADGFWAMSMDEELPNEGLSASILYRMADVTDSIVPFLSDTLSASERTTAIREITGRLKKQASEDDKYNVVVKSFFSGNEYYMFVYMVYRDVRLVGAPPSSIGKFGGDTDNWMWPRHTGDFSIFRVYSAPDGSPADYSEDNVPLIPKHSLPISLDPVKENEFSMIWGYPGSTDRYLTSSGVEFNMEYYYPPLIEVFGEKLAVWKEHMDADQEVKIQYASNYAMIANSWKYFIGQKLGIKKLDVFGEKKAQEDAFLAWVGKDARRVEKYGDVLNVIDADYKKKSSGIKPLIIASTTGVGGAELISIAQGFSGLEGLMDKVKEEKDKDKRAKKQEQVDAEIASLKEGLAETYKNYDEATDKDVFAKMTELYFINLSPDMQPEYLKKLVEKYNGNYGEVAKSIYEKSFLSNEAKAMAFLNKASAKALKKDPAMKVASEYMTKLMAAGKEYRKEGEDVGKAEKLLVQAMREMYPDKKFYPNANSTLRFSYGSVGDYYPADAVHYDFVTYLDGVMEKEDPTNDEFIVDPKLKELYNKQDYGPYGQDGKLVVCFLTNNDITGGNSGSPVMNGKGELIGLAFDGNWEAMSGDIAFNNQVQRTICVDVHYVLFIIDKFAGSTRLIDELDIRKSAPQPIRTESIATEAAVLVQ